MHLDLRVKKENAVKPSEAEALLFSLADFPFRNAELSLRHPYSAFQVTASSLSETLVRLMERIKCESAKGWISEDPEISSTSKELAALVEDAVHAVVEHFDSCRSICAVVERSFESKKAKQIVRDYSSSVKAARDFSANQANAIKHRQARIRIIQFYGASSRIPGYFVEGVSEGGSVGPDPKIHRSSKSAFSANRAARHFLASALYVSRVLAHLVSDALGISVSRENGFGGFAKALDLALVLPNSIFPDERGSDMVAYRASKNELFVQFPSPNRAWAHPVTGMKVMTTLSGDGITKTFGLPYLSATS